MGDNVTVNKLKTSVLMLALAGIFNPSVYAAEIKQSGQDRATDKLRMLQAKQGALTIGGDIQLPMADRVANEFAPQFGIRNPQAELRVIKSQADKARTHIRYQQYHQGLPIIAGQLVANINGQNQLTSMSGEVAKVHLADITPAISAEQASQIAIKAMAKWYKFEREQLISSTPVLSIFDPTLIVTAPGTSQALAWQVNVAPTALEPINEFIVIDAITGGILFHFNKVDTALSRRTYTANNQTVLPGTLVCQDPTVCSSTDTDVLNAHNFAEDTYDFYFSTHGRNGIDGNDAAIVSTVHFGGPTFQNAFWLGADPYLGASNQMVYGNGFAADDVVGHELTHGVTENESDLFYYSESGAINEALSDLWGELIDLSNGVDNPADRWLLGEDLPIGEIRDMQDPTTFNDPDRISSANFYVGADDNGGVHTNSGVNNKAVYLLVDGDTFNGQTVNGIGSTKTAQLYYRVQTQHLTTGSDYLDLYNALIAACNQLVTEGSFIAADCQDVQRALTAVEMNQTPSANYAPQATEICPAGVNVYDLFADNFEANNLNNWVRTNIVGSNNPWSTTGINLAVNSGSYTMMSDGYDSDTNPVNPDADNDSTLRTPNAIRVPVTTTMYIHFDHAYYFEKDAVANYDGGVIEYSTDNGTTWTDAQSLIESGRDYGGTLANFNPQPGRQAFVGFSNGYVSTRLDLAPLAGQFVLFRFRNLADETVASAPWFIDNFRIYICADNAPPSVYAGTDQIVNVTQNVQLTGTVSDPDGDISTTAWTQIAGNAVTLNGANTLTPSFTALNSTSNLIFRLTVTDAFGNSESDDVTVTVGFNLNGSGGNSGCTFNQQNRFDPIWLFMLLSMSVLHFIIRVRSTPQ